MQISVGDTAGVLSEPPQPRAVVALTHGAGGSRDGLLLAQLERAFLTEDMAVVRYDLPFRVRKPKGPPHPSTAERDRAGIAAILTDLRRRFAVPVFAGGHSYGGRQTSMVVADNPELADGVLLTSYPLHPPGKPDRLRVEHFPRLTVPVVFVHGIRDPFGTTAEFAQAITTISAPVTMVEIAAAHDLAPAKSDAAARAVAAITALLG